jgi:raffinose/stachyose/melibiose transport system permease protein
MVPPQLFLIPQYQIMAGLGWLNTLQALILPGMFSAFGTFLLRQFFLTIPFELSDAARVDGCSELRIFRDIILPLAKPALAALFILDFVATWNEYAIAVTLLQDQDTWTVPLALMGFSSQFTSSYGQLNAFIVMSILPVLVVYLMFQRFFTQGALAGAVKG